MYLNIHIKCKMEHYYEKNLIINNRILKYKGVFRVDELFRVINQALEIRGYEKREKKTEEIVSEAGRRTYVELRPFKLKTNYGRYLIKLKITLDNITETVEEIKSEKRKYQQGDVEIIFDAWLLTDYINRWNMKPLVYFLKAFINKFIYSFPLEGSFPGEVSSDTAYVHNQIKKLLNSYKIETGKHVKEEDVRMIVAEEIGKES
jgi:hypothetical protein